MCILPSRSEVAEYDPCSLLVAKYTESSTAAAKQQSRCPHRSFQNPLSIQKSGSCSMTYVTAQKGTNTYCQANFVNHLFKVNSIDQYHSHIKIFGGDSLL